MASRDLHLKMYTSIGQISAIFRHPPSACLKLHQDKTIRIVPPIERIGKVILKKKNREIEHMKTHPFLCDDTLRRDWRVWSDHGRLLDALRFGIPGHRDLWNARRAGGVSSSSNGRRIETRRVVCESSAWKWWRMVVITCEEMREKGRPECCSENGHFSTNGWSPLVFGLCGDMCIYRKKERGMEQCGHYLSIYLWRNFWAPAGITSPGWCGVQTTHLDRPKVY